MTAVDQAALEEFRKLNEYRRHLSGRSGGDVLTLRDGDHLAGDDPAERQTSQEEE